MSDSNADPTAAAWEELSATLDVRAPSGLYVNADVGDLLDRFNGDQAKVFDFLARLKDLLG